MCLCGENQKILYKRLTSVIKRLTNKTSYFQARQM